MMITTSTGQKQNKGSSFCGLLRNLPVLIPSQFVYSYITTGNMKRHAERLFYDFMLWTSSGHRTRSHSSKARTMLLPSQLQ
jgi:hypothetical protein